MGETDLPTQLLRHEFVTQSRRGQPVTPLMDSYTEYDGGVTSLMFFPVHWFTTCNDYGMLARFTPLAPQETEVELTWLVHPEEQEGIDYKVEEVTWLWLKTIEEDLHICADNQAGVNSQFYGPGPYSKMEGTADGFTEWYLREFKTHPRTASWAARTDRPFPPFTRGEAACGRWSRTHPRPGDPKVRDSTKPPSRPGGTQDP